MPSFITILERAEKLKQATDELAKNPNNPEKLLQNRLYRNGRRFVGK